MKFFIDTANIAEIQEGISLGVIDGVTTNPTLLAKEKGDMSDILKSICALVNGPVNAEVNSLDAAGMIKEGHELAKIHENIVIKIPTTKDGVKATKQLESDGIRCNLTLVFSPGQALVAAKVGASFVCPFVGRLDDASHIGTELIENIAAIYSNYNFKTEIVVASIRNPIHVLDSALAGADIATMPLKVIEMLIQHPMTDIGIQKFKQDWEKAQKSK